jgi:acetyl esterase/lipase
MHILARALTETEIRKSLEEGRFYLAHDWLCDPAGFMFVAENGLGAFEIGDHAPFANTTIEARVPIPARLRLLRNGEMIAEVNDSKISHAVTEEGDYRLEAWLKIDGEDRPWIYSSPLRIRKSPPLTLPFAAVPSNVEVRKDVVYVEGDPSDRAKHELDLYLPKDRKGFPAIVFLHGGTWRTGDRAQYAALGNRFASLGIGVAIPSYRLMPGHPHPAQIEDAAAAFAWVHEHLAEAGGDAARIYLLGHSAGGHLAALLALDREYLKKYDISTDAIRGVMSMSGVYNLAGVSGFISASGARDPSPLHHVHSQAPPFLVTFCQWDYLGLPKQARDFSAALKKSFVGAQLLYVAGKSHITEIIDVLRDDDPTARAILDFMK